MNIRNKVITALAAAFIIAPCAMADEGMWMVNAITQALQKNMEARGLKLSAGEIYNADAPGSALCDAVVSLDFECTGSIISDNGLVITNHHCAYSDIYSLSTDEHNYLEDGYWAFTADQEIPIIGKHMLFLRKVIDVTDEVNAILKEEDLLGKPMGMRRLSYVMEKKYKTETGLEASLSSMWSGSEYYMALYEVYSDVRLVAAPPVSIAAFGGDIDNWEWPQHKGDFAMYRIYTAPDGKPAEYSEDNVPLKPSRKLTISRSGYSEGDFAMVIGYPGRTDRYSSSAKVGYNQTVGYPVQNKVRGDLMKIMNGWMNADPSIRLKYSDRYFSLSNVQELYEGEVQCCRRFDVVSEKEGIEKDLQEWIDADSQRKAEWGEVISLLGKNYKAVEEPERNMLYYRETLVIGSRLSVFATRVASTARSKDADKRLESVQKSTASDYSRLDLRVEKDLMKYSIVTYLENVDSSCWGAFQKQVLAQEGSPEAVFEKLWASSWLSKDETITKFLNDKEADIDAYASDPLIRFLQDVSIMEFRSGVDRSQEQSTLIDLQREYTHALYSMRKDLGIVQYPDANSTMRLTYGTVGGYEPHDGVICDWKSSPEGILAKHDPNSYDFCLHEDWKAILENGKPDLNVNFLTDNDITGGNSGSPVINANGELIGLAFDGNKESLASNVSFTPDYNKCVCVDIRYVLWILENYAHLYRILEEI